MKRDGTMSGRGVRSRRPTVHVLALCTAILATNVSPSGAQERTSRLDRVFQGLAYRQLEAAPNGTLGTLSRTLDDLGVGDRGMSVASPHDPDVRYRAGRRVHRSTDRGATWVAISPELEATPAEPEELDQADLPGAPVLARVAESPLEPGVIWVGSGQGRVHLTRDGGASWLEVEAPASAADGRVVSLEPSVHRGGKVYVALVDRSSEEPTPLLYRTDDYGAEWTLLSGPESGIPAGRHVTVIREDPERTGLLFAGTSDGIFVSFDDGGSWDLFQFGMPEAEVTDLHIVGRDLLVATADRGQFVMDEIGPLRQVMDGLATGEPYLFQPSSTRVGDGRGAIFDYLLPSFVRRVRLEVLDGAGNVLASFEGPAEEGDEPDEARQVPGTRSGVHRVVWDMTPTEGDGADGVRPGVYRLRMTVDGLEEERDFEVLEPSGG